MGKMWVAVAAVGVELVVVLWLVGDRVWDALTAVSSGTFG